MSTFTSQEYLVQSGTTTVSHTPLTGATWSSVRVRWKGIDVLNAVTRCNTGSVAWHDPLLASGGYSGAYAKCTCGENSGVELATDKSIPNTLFPATYVNHFVAGTMTYKVKNMYSPAGSYTHYLYVKDSAGNYVNTANTGALAAYAEGYAAAPINSSMLSLSGKKFNAGCNNNAFTLYSQAWYNITWDEYSYKSTATPTVSANNNNQAYLGTIPNGTWTSWISCPASFLIGGSNSLSFSIQGSLKAYFQFAYDYIIPTPIDGWTEYGELADFRSYEALQNGYATTLMSGTWATISGLNYGNGSIVLEFKENIGNETGVTWVVNDDIFRFDYDYDTSKLATVIQSKGSKVSGPLMYTIMSDWATALTLSASVDTFLKESVAAGATRFYAMSALPTADTDVFFLSPNTSRRECVTVINSWSDATGIAYGVTAEGGGGAFASAHYLLEECVGASDAKWYFTADSAADLTSWYSTMVAQYGAPDGAAKELDPYWPIKVGSEIVYMYRVSASDSTSITFRGATSIYRGQYDIAYSHSTGAKAFCVPTVGLYAKDGSMYDTYGTSEVTINPLSVVDTDTLDTYCYNGLMNSTTSGTTARGIIPAALFPATIGIGDWVYIAHE